jgi:hypothetical protein
VPANFTAPQLRVLLRAFITCDLYGQSDVVATHYAGNDDNNQSSEEILLSVADRLEEVQLPELGVAAGSLLSHPRSKRERNRPLDRSREGVRSQTSKQAHYEEKDSQGTNACQRQNSQEGKATKRSAA